MKQRVRFCTTPSGVRLAWSMAGDGPPLVKAANWLSHIEYDWESPIWRPWVEGLASRSTYVRYDERGCGLSDWNVKEFNLEAWVEDLETVVDAAGFERFPLLGISQGGPIAIAYAVKHPERVSQLVLYGSYARGRLLRDPTPAQIEETNMTVSMIRHGWGRDNPAFRQVFTSLFVPDANPEQVRWFNELQRVTSTPENAARMVEAFHYVDVRDRAPRVTAPTLVLHAKGDERIPFEEGRIIASLIPNAQFVSLDSRNHILLEGEPAFERFLNEVHAFLGREPAIARPAAAVFPELTDREREILDLIARGLNNALIAERLSITPKTVRNHVSRVFEKLDLRDRAQAIVRAREAGLGA